MKPGYGFDKLSHRLLGGDNRLSSPLNKPPPEPVEGRGELAKQDQLKA